MSKGSIRNKDSLKHIMNEIRKKHPDYEYEEILKMAIEQQNNND